MRASTLTSPARYVLPEMEFSTNSSVDLENVHGLAFHTITTSESGSGTGSVRSGTASMKL